MGKHCTTTVQPLTFYTYSRFFPKCWSFLELSRTRVSKIFLEGSGSKYFSFATLLLYKKVTTDNLLMNSHNCVPIKMYTQKQATSLWVTVWVVVCWLLNNYIDVEKLQAHLKGLRVFWAAQQPSFCRAEMRVCWSICQQTVPCFYKHYISKPGCGAVTRLGGLQAADLVLGSESGQSEVHTTYTGVGTLSQSQSFHISTTMVAL